MFSGAAGTIQVLTTDTTDGFAFTVNVNLDGSTSVTNYSSQTAVTPVTSSGTPEPASSILMSVAAAVLALHRRRYQAR